MKKLLIGLVLCIAIGGCASHKTWTHPTKDQLAFERDRDICMAESQRQAVIADCPRGFHCNKQATQAITFDRCMDAHGWQATDK